MKEMDTQKESISMNDVMSVLKDLIIANKRIEQKLDMAEKRERDYCRQMIETENSFKVNFEKIEKGVKEVNRKVWDDTLRRTSNQVAIEYCQQEICSMKNKLDESESIVDERITAIECEMREKIAESVKKAEKEISRNILEIKEVPGYQHFSGMNCMNYNLPVQMEQLPNFFGSVTHNPMSFLKNLNDFVESIPGERNKLHVARNCMKDEARTWFEYITEEITTWEQFKDAFQRQYWSQSIQQGIRTNLLLGAYRKDKNDDEDGVQGPDVMVIEINNSEIESPEDIDEIEIDCDVKFKSEIKKILKQYVSLVDKFPSFAVGYEHSLEVDESKPFKIKNYPIPKSMQGKVREEISRMLRDGVIERGITRYVNPLVVVQKKTGDIRLCLDARRLNERTRPQFETPVTVETLIARCTNANVYTKLDLKSSFWLIPLNKASRKFCGFMVDGNVYQFKVVPYGLSSSAAALIRAMQQILEPFNSFVTHYIDDILTFSENLEDHILHISQIIEVLANNGLKVNLGKCEFTKCQVKFLGYYLSQNYVSVDEARLEVIKNYPRPTNVKLLRGFLGVVNYYKRFVPRLAHISAPLFQLLRKNEKFSWTADRIAVFENVKSEFHKSLSLLLPDFSKEFLLRVDASDTAVSGVLIQIGKNGEEPICFVSRILKSYELKYTVSEKEMLSVVHAVNKLRFYLLGKKFIIESDHAALTALMSTRFSNNRIYRWSLLLSEYVFEIRHIKGVLNITADALSRMHNIKSHFNHVELNAYNRYETEALFDFVRINEVQQDETFNPIREALVHIDNFKDYVIQDGILMKTIRDQFNVVLTEAYTRQAMAVIHESLGHIGGRKVWLTFREAFFAVSDKTISKDVVRSCLQCQLGKSKNRTCQNVIKSVVVHNKLDIVAIDFLGNLIPGSFGYRNIFVMVDIFTKFVRLFPTRYYNTDTAIRCVDNFIMNQGRMCRILADNATYFNTYRFTEAMIDRSINVSFSSIRHPCGNPCERYIQAVVKFLRIQTHQRHVDWVRHVQNIEDWINHTPNTTTEECPYTLMYERIPSRPSNLLEEDVYLEARTDEARRKLQLRGDQYVRRENAKIVKRTRFEVGDSVLVRRYRVARRDRFICPKLDLPYEGPYRVARVFNGVTYELQIMDGMRGKGRYHISALQPFHLDPG